MPPLSAFLALLKFRLLTLVLVSTGMGFYLAAGPDTTLAPLWWTLLGISLTGGGANTLNQWKERANDALMQRTRHRPLPSGRVTPTQALWFGGVISLAGFLVLGYGANPLTLLLGFASWASYLFLYTPLKTRSPLNTWVGAVPGAIPAILGCTAATGTLDGAALALFLILYVWQMPHFFAISWVYRDDYVRGGFKMLSWDDATGARTARQILIHTVLLVPVSAGLYLTKGSGAVYLWSALAFSGLFVVFAVQLWRAISLASAKRVFRYSIVYLPLLFIAMIADRMV